MDLTFTCDSIGGGNAVLTPWARHSQDASDGGQKVTQITVAATGFPGVEWTVGAHYLISFRKTTG